MNFRNAAGSVECTLLDAQRSACAPASRHGHLPRRFLGDRGGLLRVLGLANNHLGPEGMQILADALAPAPKRCARADTRMHSAVFSAHLTPGALAKTISMSS